MADKEKSYRQLKEELDSILSELETNADDIDKAIDQYKNAQAVIARIEKYLKKVKVKVDILKPPK